MISSLPQVSFYSILRLSFDELDFNKHHNSQLDLFPTLPKELARWDKTFFNKDLILLVVVRGSGMYDFFS